MYVEQCCFDFFGVCLGHYFPRFRGLGVRDCRVLSVWIFQDLRVQRLWGCDCYLTGTLGSALRQEVI